MLKLAKCDRENLCVDCDDPKCLLAGDIGADCPAWICQRPMEDCDDCDWIKKYVEKVRNG